MQVAGGVALAALIVVVGALVYLHVAPTGLSPVRNAVSHYGITKFRMGYRVATLAFAVSGLALAVAISRATNGHATGPILLLVVFGAARGLISWYPMDAPGSLRTGTGAIHGLLALAAFGGVTIAALRIPHALTDQRMLHGLATTSKVLGFVMLILLICMGLSRSYPALGKRFGLVERGFYLAAIVWFAVFSIGCIARVH